MNRCFMFTLIPFTLIFYIQVRAQFVGLEDIKSVFPQVTTVEILLGNTMDPFKLLVSQLIKTSHQNDLLEIKSSHVEKIFLVYSGLNGKSSYSDDHKVLELAFSGCSKAARDEDSIIVGLHEYAHSLFHPNLFHGLPSKTLEASTINENIRIVVHPFHELFADTYTVLSLDDPRAMNRFLFRCSEKRLKDRDFSAIRQLNGWDVGPLVGNVDKRHLVFDPARHAIWKIYEDSILDRKLMKQIILRAIVDVSRKMIIQLYDNDKGLSQLRWERINQEELNRKFIELFNKMVIELSSLYDN